MQNTTVILDIVNSSDHTYYTLWLWLCGFTLLRLVANFTLSYEHIVISLSSTVQALVSTCSSKTELECMCCTEINKIKQKTNKVEFSTTP